MSAASADWEKLLRDAIEEAKAAHPMVIDDLVRSVSKATEAITKVTNGMVVLELAPIPAVDQEQRPVFRLELKTKTGDARPASLGIYRLSDAGYPVERWWSEQRWKSHRNEANEVFSNLGALEGHFKWMVSNPSSRLVTLITYYLQQMREAEQPANGKA